MDRATFTVQQPVVFGRASSRPSVARKTLSNRGDVFFQSRQKILSPTLRFGLQQEEARQGQAGVLGKIFGKRELVISRWAQGDPALDVMMAAEQHLTTSEQMKLDAYKLLVAFALRPVNLPEAAEKAIQAKLDNPDSLMQSWLNKLDMTADDFREPLVNPVKIDRDNDVPAAVVTRMGKLGLSRLKIDQQYGGMHFNQRQYAQVLDVLFNIGKHLGPFLASQNIPIPTILGSSTLGCIVSAQSTIGSAPLALFGTPEQKAKYFPKIAKGESHVAFGLTEPLAGTAIDKASTTAVQQPDGSWKLSGQKIYITNTLDAGLIYFYVNKTIVDGIDKGPTIFISELPFKLNESFEAKKAKIAALAEKGLTIMPFTGLDNRLMMIRGSDQAFIEMNGFDIPAENTLGEVGNGKITFYLSLNRGRAGFGPAGVASAVYTANQVTSHAVDRIMMDEYKKPDQPHGFQADIETVQKDIGKMHLRSAMTAAASELVTGLIDAHPDASVASLAALIKVMATEDNWLNAVDGLRLFGGEGLVEGAPNGMERMMRDAFIGLIVEGNNPALSQLGLALGVLKVMDTLSPKKLLQNFVKAPIQERREQALTTLWLRKDKKGEIPAAEARWLATYVRAFSRNFGIQAILRGIKGASLQQLRNPKTRMEYINNQLPRGSEFLIDSSRVVQNLLRIAGAQVKLAKYGDSLSPEERRLLEIGTRVYQDEVRKQLKAFDIRCNILNIRGEDHKADFVEAGNLMIDANRREKPLRVDTQAEFLGFLARQQRLFFDALPQPV